MAADCSVAEQSFIEKDLCTMFSPEFLRKTAADSELINRRIGSTSTTGGVRSREDAGGLRHAGESLVGRCKAAGVRSMALLPGRKSSHQSQFPFQAALNHSSRLIPESLKILTRRSTPISWP